MCVCVYMYIYICNLIIGGRQLYTYLSYILTHMSHGQNSSKGGNIGIVWDLSL